MKNLEKDKIINELARLRRFSGTPAAFWAEFIQVSTRIVDAEFGLLMVKEDGQDAWKYHCVWPAEQWDFIKRSNALTIMEKVADAVSHDGSSFEDIKQSGQGGLRGAFLGVRLDLGEDERVGTALFFMNKTSSIQREDAVMRLHLLSGVPVAYQMRRIADKAKNDVVCFVEALDLMVLMNAEKRYMAAAMLFCNEIASRFACLRVSLGWLKDGYIRVQAISHMENFEKKMDAVQSLEAAMEEAFDQDEEVLYPQAEEGGIVIRDHESFARAHGVHYMISLPLRLDDEPVAVLTCERQEKPFSEHEVHGLRLLCDQASRRLGDLKKHDRWCGARLWEWVKEGLALLLGVEHTLAKSIGIIICILLAILIFGKWNYRIEAPFILKTDDLAYLPAPFDGYIDKVHVQVGDRVKENDPLLALDTSELLLEESAAIADQSRYARESEKARAKNTLAEMQIAQALKVQAEAKLSLIRYHLDNAQLRAPFSGIVVEGDLKELLGAPVRKGDVLFKVARIEKMYAELDIDERDVHEIEVGRTGQIAFVSMPQHKFPITVQLIDPVAVAKDEGNVFPIRCSLDEMPGQWWRPGMSGIAKVNVGKRNLLWIFTHRTVDFFRILLWW